MLFAAAEGAYDEWWDWDDRGACWLYDDEDEDDAGQPEFVAYRLLCPSCMYARDWAASCIEGER